MPSESPIYFFERIDTAENNFADINTRMEGVNTFRPKQTAYKLGTRFNDEYKSYFKTYGENDEFSYADLLSPPEAYWGVSYWVATRCLDVTDKECYYCLHKVESSCLAYGQVWSSGLSYSTGAPHLFPVVTVSSELIKKGENSKFIIE